MTYWILEENHRQYNCVYTRLLYSSAEASGEGGAGGAAPPNSEVYNEVYFDTDSEGEETPGKRGCSPDG